MDSNPACKPGRLEWIDAMRGFTMLLVVANHVSLISFGENLSTSVAMKLLVLFRMPLFFFVSGFLAYRARFLWGAGETLQLLWKKIRIQLIPTLLFLCIFLILRRGDFVTSFTKAMMGSTKAGYWFTLALLYMFMAYYLFSFLLRKFSRRNLVFAGIWFLSIAAYETAFLPQQFKYPTHEFWRYSSLIQVVIYFHFFMFGNIVRRYWDRIQRLLDSRWFFPLLSVICFLSCTEFLKWHTMRMAWANLPKTVAMYSSLIMVLMFFRHYSRCFTQQTRLGRSLQYVGTRTLDVYLLHYIFLPVMPSVGVWLNANRPNFLLSIACSVSVAVLIIGACLICSNLLRISPLYSEHLFGRKKTDNK